MVIRIPHSHMTTPGWNWVVASCLRTFLLISGTFLALQVFEFVVPVLHIPCNHFSWKSYCIPWRLLPGTTMGLSATQTSSRDIPSLPCSLWHLSAPGWRTISSLNGFIQTLCPTYSFLSTSGKLSVPHGIEILEIYRISDGLVFSDLLQKQRTYYSAWMRKEQVENMGRNLKLISQNISCPY